MPTYQYACKECGHRFEAIQAFSEASLSECPVCEGQLRKVFNSVGVVFKGSGFYRNDSRDSAKTSTAASPAKESSTKSSDSSSDKSASTSSSSSSSSTTSSTTTSSSTSTSS